MITGLFVLGLVSYCVSRDAQNIQESFVLQKIGPKSYVLNEILSI